MKFYYLYFVFDFQSNDEPRVEAVIKHGWKMINNNANNNGTNISNNIACVYANYVPFWYYP